ncbi:MAG: NAD(P)H-dependent oxidoreductase [Candidatus Omnitrophica bacterium]|nr:NAD(P)H-dependent oxidoreductase [Candidatus Omnitrophota bacterium]
MKKLLHIIATPRGSESRTLSVSKAFLDVFKTKYPECEIEELNLFEEKLPDLTVKKVNGKYVLLSGKDLSGDLKESWKEIVSFIERFLYADSYLISTPMWNFSIPYRLKHYIDIILQPKYLFQYTPNGPEGLAKGKKMAIITSRGGDYSAEDFRKFDLQTPYLYTVFNFAGISDIVFVNAQPMDAMGPEIQAKKIKEAQAQAREIAKNF